MKTFDPQRVWLNVRKSETRDLLNRLTVFRGGMEPEALDIIETELNKRGFDRHKIADYDAKMHEQVVMLSEDMAVKCTSCQEPAIREGWGWHRLFGFVPVMPRYYFYCRQHARDEVALDDPFLELNAAVQKENPQSDGDR